MLNSHSTKRLIAYQLASLGLYWFYWCSVSRREINTVLGRNKIPSTWLLIIPGLNYWWMWLYAEALESVTRLRLKRSDTFLFYILSTLGWSFLQPGLRLTGDSSSASSPIDRHILTFWLIGAAVVIYLAVLAGNTFYCCTMQRKIDAVRRRR